MATNTAPPSVAETATESGAERTADSVAEHTATKASAETSVKAVLYRMADDRHVCPFGLKSRFLLRREGFEVEEHLLGSREEIDAFKAEHGVRTTPQTFIGGERVGGFEALRERLGEKARDPDRKTYTPVVAVFAVAFLMALAASWSFFGELFTVRAIEWFVAFSMCILAILKLRDIESFSTMFLGYDLLARRHVRYAYAYPFCEALVGILMIAGALAWLSIPTALFIGSIGAASVFKAVYIDKRDLKCACVGGSSNVPLGFVSLTENLAMVGMALWMLAK